jgi:hypothetical protein
LILEKSEFTESEPEPEVVRDHRRFARVLAVMYALARNRAWAGIHFIFDIWFHGFQAEKS